MTETKKSPAPKKKTAKKKAVKKAAPKRDGLYINITAVNIFTENGRVKPNAKVFMTEEQAKPYKGLQWAQEEKQSE